MRNNRDNAAVRLSERNSEASRDAGKPLPGVQSLVSDHLTGHGAGDSDFAETQRKPILSLTDPIILAAIMTVDAIAVFSGSVASWQLYHRMLGLGMPDWRPYIYSAAILAGMFLVRSLGAQVYGHVWGMDRRQALLKNFSYFTQAFLVFVTFLVMTRLAVTYSRGSLVLQFLVCGGTLLALRSIEFSLLQDQRVKKLIVANRVILVGSPENIQATKKNWNDWQENVQVVKSFPLWLDASNKDMPVEYLAAFAEVVIRTSRAAHADRIVILLPFERTREISFLVDRFADLPASILVCTESLSTAQAKPEALIVGGLPMLRVIRKPLTGQEQVIKRAFDLLAASTLLLLLSPLLLGVALAIRLDSPGAAMFRQSRKGFNQAKFRIFKFRTMRVALAGEAFRQTGQNDSRITKVGAFLRRWNIDELPQLINVLRGEMSLVGPRPHAIEHDDMYYDKIASYARRHNIKPGITGLAQALGHRGPTDTLKQMQDRLDCDVTYIQNWSLLLDLKIMLMTVFSSRAYRNAF